jgi:drug/metabolite transporter (DMT)-like permease
VSRGSLARIGVLALIWGSSFLLIKLALEGFTPLQMVIGRLVTAATVLLVVVAVRRQALPRERAVWAHLAVMSVIANVVPFFLFGFAQQRITSGLAGILNGATPLFTLGFAVVFLADERLTPARLVGFLAGFVGVVLVIGPWDTNPLTSSVTGQLACLLAAACYGVGFVYTRRHLSRRGYAPLALAAGQVSCAAVIALLLVPFAAGTPMDLRPSAVAGVVALGAFGTGFAYLLFYRLISDEGATSASTVTYVLPIVAVTLGVVLLGEPVGWNLFAGSAVVIAGVAVAEGRLGLPWVAASAREAASGEASEPTVDAPVVPPGQDP